MLARSSRSLATLALALGLATAVWAQEKPASPDVIYPRNSGTTESGAGGTKAERGNNLSLVALALLAAAAGGWMLWKQRQGGGALGAADRKLSIAESRSLGNRQHLVVADYDGRKFLLGVCPGRIDLLAKLDESDGEELP